MIDQELYVDGGVTGNIQYGGRRGEENTIPAIWQKLYPELPIPKIRMWVIFNNQFPPGAGSDGAKLGGGYSTEPGHGQPCCDGVRRRRAAPAPAAAVIRWGAGGAAPQPLGAGRVAGGVVARCLLPATGGYVCERDHEQFSRPGQKDGR